MADFDYLSLSEGIYGDRLVKKANLTVDSVHCGWRDLLSGPGSSERLADARAGGRYYNTFARLGLTSDDNKINQAAAQLSSAAANRDLRDLLEGFIHGALDPDRPTVPFPPLGPEEKFKLLRLIWKPGNPVRAQQRITGI